MDTPNTSSFNFQLLIFLYIITASFAFISKIGTIVPNPIIYYGIFLFWIIIAFIKLVKNNFKINEKEKVIIQFFWIFFIPKITIHIYSLFLYIIGETTYFTRNTQSYLIIFSVFSIIYIFKNNALKYTIIAALVSYIWVIIYNISFNGISSIFNTIAFILSGNLQYDESARLYEVHDYTFAIGYIVLYYILIKDKFTQKSLFATYLFTIFLLLGLKRIQILALLVVIIYNLFTKIIKNKIRFYKITGYAFLSVSYLYIYFLSNSVFFDLLIRFGINSMGRNFYYKAIIDLCTFSPTFLGLGRNMVNQLLTNQFSYMNVAGVHSDILKYFAECGFILFGVWLWYFLVKIVKILNKRYNFKVIHTYFILTLYTFIIYYTDNIDIYFVSQFIYIIIIVIIALKETNSIEESIKN